IMNIINSKLDSYWHKIIILCAIIVSAFTLYTSIFGTLAGPVQKSIHLFLITPIAFYFYPQKSLDKEQPLYIINLVFKIAITVITVITIAEYYLKWESLFISAPSTSEMTLGIIGIVLMLEVTRRSIGWSLPIISIIFLVYAYFGPFFPQVMQHKGFSITEIAQWTFYG